MKTINVAPQAGIRLKKFQALLVGILTFGFGFSLVAGTPRLASVLNPAVGTLPGGDGDSTSAVVSPDGRYVLFASCANNLVLNSNNAPILLNYPSKMNVYLRDLIKGTTVLVSVDSTGMDGGNGDSYPVAISTNGQFVLFESAAANLLPTDTTGSNNIFIRDLVHNTTSLVSVNTNGVAGNGVSRDSVMTPDGHYVAFVSAASDLVPGDTNGIADVFVRDMQLGSTILASPGAVGWFTNSSELPDITPDGHYVAFYSTATNLVSGVTNQGEIYVRDLVGGVTTWVSGYAHTAMQQLYNVTNIISFNHVISDDGQYIAFEAACNTNFSPYGTITSLSNSIVLRYNQFSSHTDIVATNATGIMVGSELNHHFLDMTPDGRFVAFVGNPTPPVQTVSNPLTNAIYRWDGMSNSTVLVSGTAASNALPSYCVCDWPVMDTTGRYVAFIANATGLTTNSPSSAFHIYRRDMQSGITRLVDVDANGNSPVEVKSVPSMSDDGSVIVFDSPDTTLVPNDNNHAYDVFAVNLACNTIALISAAHPDLQTISPNGPSALQVTSVSATARYIAFSSEADNLVPGDTNGLRDVFVRDLLLNSNMLVSVDTNGVLPGNNLSTDSCISTNGRYVAFTSYASNLVAGDTNNCSDVFIRDLQLGATTLVSVNTNGTGPGNSNSYSPTISSDGRYVFFRSVANNLAAGIPSTNYENFYWRDIQAGITKVFATNASGNGTYGAMTSDGQYVTTETATFSSRGPLYVWNTLMGTTVYTNTAFTNSRDYIQTIALSPDGNRMGVVCDTNGLYYVYAIDRNANTTVNIGNYNTQFTFRFSGDSRYMVYVAAIVNGPYTNQVFCYDFQTGTNRLISQSTNGVPGNANSESPDISSDGRYIAYRSAASNLGPGATNGVPNLYLYDSLAGTTTLLSGSSTLTGRSLTPVFSADAQTLVFSSWDAGFTPQDFNQWNDIFALSLYDTNAQPAFSAVLSSPPIKGQLPVITWTTTPGKNYQVQFKNDLSDPVWQVLNGSMSINGSQESMTDPSPSSSRRFYRVVSY